MEKLILKVDKSLSNLPTIDYRTLKPLQGDLKELSEKNKQKLLKSFAKQGFFVPFFVWENKGVKYLLDGHQRTTVLSENNAEPFELPYVAITAKDRKEAKTKLLAIDSKYGKATAKGLESFLSEDDMDFDFILEETTFDDLLNFDADFETEPMGRMSFGSENENSFAVPNFGGSAEYPSGASANYSGAYENNNQTFSAQTIEDDFEIEKSETIYSKKVDAPIYEPKNLKPQLSDIFNNQKTNMLIEEIKQSNISKEEKDFLILAAQRHTVFNYEMIADYYSHASKEMQELMENSALVIIDFNKAIELGYIQLCETIKNEYIKNEE